MEAEVKREFDRLNTKLTAILSSQNKQTWIGAWAVEQLTGWGSEARKSARSNGILIYKEGKGYLLESIPQQFHRKTA